VRRDVFEGLRRRLGVDVVQGESENATAAETICDQRAKRWELMYVHGQCSADGSERDEKEAILRRSVTDGWSLMKMAKRSMYLL
jgi:hypothetical protein